MEFYNQSSHDVLFHFTVNPKEGLSTADVEKNREKYGRNELPKEKKDSLWDLAKRQVTGPLVPVLFAALVITVLLQEFIDATVIAITLILNIGIGLLQEFKAQEAILSLQSINAPLTVVFRDGHKVEVPSSEIVPGDIILLSEGMIIPADGRIIEYADLQIDESILTGESTYVSKTSEIIQDRVVINDQKNMVFSGTNVVRGTAKYVVTSTGADTEMGNIAEKVRGAVDETTPLQKQLLKLSKVLVYSIGALVVVLFIGGVLSGASYIEMFLFSVALAVSVIPEGLIISITIALAVGMYRMAKRNAIVRTLPAVEALGSVTVIATDKTGTLTENKLSVISLFVNGYDRDTHDPISLESPSGLAFSTALALANDAELTVKMVEDVVGVGDPLEIGVLQYLENHKIDYIPIRKRYVRLHELPFSSDYKMMGVHVIDTVSKNRFIYVKGSPHEIMEISNKIQVDNVQIELTKEYQEGIIDHVQSMADKALKPLAYAVMEIEHELESLTLNDIRHGFTFLGLVGFADPLREEALESVKKVKHAGIRVMMLTGDHALTAKRIAESAGIETQKVVDGSSLLDVSDEERISYIAESNVFARVTPEYKLDIVHALKKNNEIVAMTGDGVNDAPALISADVGVAMGEGGTDVARNASDIILTDNNFATIVAAIEEGRGIFDNIKKVVLFLLSTNVSEVILMVTALVVSWFLWPGLPLPLYPTQILWLNLVTDGFPDIALIFEPKEKGVLARPPRRPNEFILDKFDMSRMTILGFWMAIIAFIVFAYYWNMFGVEYARTMTLLVMAFMQLMNAFNMKVIEGSIRGHSLFNNMWLLWGIVISSILQVMLVSVPFLQTMFRTTSISLNDWGVVLVLSVTILVLDEIIRYVYGKIKLRNVT